MVLYTFIHYVMLAPTAVALTSSLLSHSLPPHACRKHLAIFCISTPLAAVLTYEVMSLFGASDQEDLVGNCLLLSGGTFLYVATVLQSMSKHRVMLIVLGMIAPYLISKFIEH